MQAVLSPLTLCGTSSLFTRPVQLIFSILLHHHISKPWRYFWSTFRSVQVSAPYKGMLQMLYITSFFLIFTFSCCWKPSFWMLFLPWKYLIQIYAYIILHHLLSGYPNSLNIPHSPVVFKAYFKYFRRPLLHWQHVCQNRMSIKVSEVFKGSLLWFNELMALPCR
jgi:hypothetical protein